MNGALGGSLPAQVSEMAKQWDNLYIGLFWICVFFFVIVIAPMVVFAFKYRNRPGHKAKYFVHNTPLEIFWTAVPTVILLGIFAWGWIVYKDMITPVKNAMEIRVMGQSWKWTFQYEDGRMTDNQIFVPVGKPVRLIMTAPKSDVVHSFFIPNLRIKQDVVPGMYTYLNFQVDVPGQHQVFCAEYCGTNHAYMQAKLIALDERQWKLFEWGKKIKEEDFPPVIGLGSVAMAEQATQTDAELDSGSSDEAPTQSLVDQGRSIATAKACQGCHSEDGSPRVGPSYKGLYGKMRTLKDGSQVEADDNYLRESIENPQAKIVKGFENMVMPPYAGQLSPEEMNAVIAYIKSLK
jgi:cytochrome c oxidase subunit 2